jgi:hypothetical protein
MRKLVMPLLFLACLAVTAYAQQDPNDPGIQDSVIVGGGEIGGNFTYAQIYMVTDDSVMFYNFPLRWIVTGGDAHPDTVFTYFPPLNYWDDCFDTVLTNEGYIRQFGFSDLGGEDNPPLITNGLRINVWNLRIFFGPDLPSLVILDTTWDSRNGGLKMGLAGGYYEFIPGFRRGYFSSLGVDDDINNKPLLFSLAQNYPNPFNSSTEIEFSLPKNGQVSLVIYDIQGREVRRLLDCNLEAGSHSVIWDGLNDNGGPVSSGIYFYRLVSNNSAQTNRMTMLR